MGLDMYFEGTFSTRAFSERDPNNYKRENVEIDLDFEFAKNVKLGKGRFISKVKRNRPKKQTVNWVKKNKPEGF